MPKFVEKWMPELFIIIVLVLVAIGVLMTYSSSVYYAELKFGNKFHFFYREIFWVVIGIISAIVADRLAKNRRHVSKFMRGVLFPLIIVMIPVGLIVVEPDLGTPMVILTTAVAMFYIAGTKIMHLFFLALAAVPALVFLVFKFPYRLKRLLTFWSPDSDPLGAGFQIRQSLIAVGSGQLHGLGLGKSIQKMHYLPEAHTDFVFAIIGEELGFIGAGAIIVLMMIFLYVTYKLTQQITDMFGHLVAVGIMTVLSLQMIVNIGVVTAILPTKGLALPFISYGGSSMVMTLAACGLLVNIVYNQRNLHRDQLKTPRFDETVI